MLDLSDVGWSIEVYPYLAGGGAAGELLTHLVVHGPIIVGLMIDA